MGKSIIVGIATKIYVKKTYKYNIEQVKEILSKKLNLSLYDIIEDDNDICLSIKPKIFSENIINLLKNEYKILGIDNNKVNNELLKKLKNIPYNQILNEIENKKISTGNFQFLEGNYNYLNDISYIDNNEKLTICADIIAFYLSDKVILESYFELFNYLRNKIVEAMDNPLKDDIFITLFG